MRINIANNNDADNYQGVPMPGRKFRTNKNCYKKSMAYRPIGKFLRCRSNEVLKLWGAQANEQMVVQMPRKWHETKTCTTDWMNRRSNESVNQWITWIMESMNQSMTQWIPESSNKAMSQWITEATKQWIKLISESKNQWINESLKQRLNEAKKQWISGTNELMNQRNDQATTPWFSESVSQRTNASLNQSITESNKSMNQWTSESVNQWPKESVSPWIKKSMNQWMCEWMDGWMNKWMEWAFSLLSYFFTERPLRRGTSSLSHFFSEQPLIWATSALNSLPATSSVSLATQFFPSRSQHKAFCNLQLRSRIAQTWHYAETLPLTQLLHCVSQPQAAILHSRSVAVSLMLSCVQPCRCILPQPVANPHNRASHPSFFLDILMQIQLWLQSCALLSAAFPDRGPQPQKQRPYFGNPRSHIARKRVSAKVFSPVNSHAPGPFLSSTAPKRDQSLLTMWWTWWQDCPWTSVGSSAVFELNFLWIMAANFWESIFKNDYNDDNNNDTSSTAQGGGGSFKNRKPIGEVGCCESGMAERSHWWTERCLISLSLSLYLPIYLAV